MNNDISSHRLPSSPQIVEISCKEIIVSLSFMVRVPSSFPLSLIETPPIEIVASLPLLESGHCSLVPRKKNSSISL
jgi:hypothetical protein